MLMAKLSACVCVWKVGFSDFWVFVSEDAIERMETLESLQTFQAILEIDNSEGTILGVTFLAYTVF